jgi:hypothetical protein
MLRRNLAVLLAAVVVVPGALAQNDARSQVREASQRVLPYPIDLPPAFHTAIANGTRTLNGRPGPKHWTSKARYSIEAELDPKTAVLTGKATLVFMNRSPAKVDRLVVHLYQNMMKAGVERTRTVEATDGITVESVALAGKPIRAQARGGRGRTGEPAPEQAEADYRIHDTRMDVRLGDQAVPPGGEVALQVSWHFPVPKAGTAPRMGHEAENVFYLGYWYPQFAVYDDVEGWVADQYRGNGEFYMDYADYEVALTVPQGYLVRATGELSNPLEVLTDKERAALEKAHSGRDIVHVLDAGDLKSGAATATAADGRLTWRFHADNVRDFAVSAARTYLWDATNAVVKDRDGPGKDGVAMIHAVYEASAGGWARAAEYARHTIEYMSAHVHPYQWPHMTACEGIIGGGMEYPMMTIIGPRGSAGTITHELIHMWFPMLVGSNEKRCAWQDEGFTSFFTTLCNDDFVHSRNGPQRDILVGYVNTVRRGNDASCMRHADAYGDDNFQFASYGKTAAILHQLRGMLGDEVFFKAFRRYAADWAFKHPYPYDFFRTFSDVAGQDLDDYFRTWFYETWQLDHAIASVQIADGKTVVMIKDLGRAMHPAVVQATFADGSTARAVVTAAEWRQAVVAVRMFVGEAVKVVIDPDLTSLDCDRTNNTWPVERPDGK